MSSTVPPGGLAMLPSYVYSVTSSIINTTVHRDVKVILAGVNCHHLRFTDIDLQPSTKAKRLKVIQLLLRILQSVGQKGIYGSSTGDTGQ